ncbi:MAG: endolytic transglycosylase MltG [Eubacteriales bacterium]|nr:endolytic transglycosylase MltG [Eubacteriales bacterium]
MESLLAPKPEPPVQEDSTPDQEYRDNGPEFDEIMNAPPPERKVPSRKRPARKGRPKKTTGEGLWGIPNILVTVVWLALIVAIGVTAGRMMWVCAADVLAFGREDKAVTVTVYETDTMDDIVDKLYDAGLIRYKSLFSFYAKFAHAEEKIQPGFHDLNTKYDYHALVNFMGPRSSRTVIKLMIPEGYTSAQIFALLEENKVCTAVDIASYAATGELDDYWFLADVERGSSNSLEGFLFPDTYEFYQNDTPRNILQKMLNNFDNRFDEEMIGKIDSLNAYLADLMRRNGRDESYIEEHRFTVREVAIVASMIEKETAHSGESPIIASVIYNRLFNWGDTPAYLNIDAAIVYALGGKTDLTREDLQVESPYNTYLNTGLTPTPIANPGLTSLKAALEPESTDYYFYVLNPAEGSHQFATTREEHEANVARFNSAEG